MDKKITAIKAEHWKQVLHSYNLAQQETGISKTDWCAQNGIGIKSLFRWQRILRSEAEEQRSRQKQEIVPVQIVSYPEPGYAESASHSNIPNEIILGKDGIILRFPMSISAEYLLTMVRGIG